jgi:Sensors of blue-light using FAD
LLCFAAQANLDEKRGLHCWKDCHHHINEEVPSMLIRLIYLSRPVGPQTAALTDSILRKAHAWNTQNDITGMLCEGQGVYLQVLEGERGKVTGLYARIHADPRHKDLELLHCESITERRYAGWSMARVSVSDVDPHTKIVWPEFDPYSAAGGRVMARIDELVARGSPVQAAQF